VPFALIYLIPAQRSVEDTRDVSKGEMWLFARLSPAHSRVGGDGKEIRKGQRSIVISSSETSSMLNIAKTTNRDILRIEWAHSA
jgi:hypothetical protein